MGRGAGLQQEFKDLIDTLAPTEVYFYGDDSGSTTQADWIQTATELVAYVTTANPLARVEVYSFFDEVYFTAAAGPGFSFPIPGFIIPPTRVL
jgi:hypothetical protein